MEGKGMDIARAPQFDEGSSRPDHNELVERITPLYPVGTWRASVWILAAKAIAKRLDEGTDAEALIEAAELYRDQQTELGNIGTRFVLSPAKFYGDEGDWRGPFPIPRTPSNANGTGKTFAEIHAALATDDDDERPQA